MSERFNPKDWHMPAEWKPHEGTWISWPHNEEDWPGKFAPIPWVYAEIVRHLHYGEKVHVLVRDQAMEEEVKSILKRNGVSLPGVEFLQIVTDRVWTRDYGPIFVVDDGGAVAMTDWHFNAWAKYDNWQSDDEVPGILQQKIMVPSFQPRWQGKRVVLEGGSIDVNGAGLLLTTEECLLSPLQERNPGFGRKDYEEIFATYLGIGKTLWLGKGIAGDDTHGHVDDLARFVNERTIVTVVENNPADENYRPLRENLERLQGMTDQHGKRLTIVELPMPSPVFFAGQRLPASYANFFIANDRVLVPTFNDGRDRQALGILADLFPDRQVVGIHAVDLVWGLGTLHCLTQQQPAGK